MCGKRALSVYQPSRLGSRLKSLAGVVPRFWAGLALLAAAQLLAAPDVAAGIAVSPLQQEVTVRPGREAQFSVRVTNVKRAADARPQSVTVEVMDFSVSRDGGISFGEACKHSRSAVGWIGIDAGELVLRPGESRGIKGTVRAPFSADGDYWAAVMVTIGGPEKRQEGVNVVLRTASGIFVHVARRNYVERLSIGSLQVTPPRFDRHDNPGVEPGAEGAPVAPQNEQVLNVAADVINEGVGKFIASGTAALYLDGRRCVARIPLHAHRRRILPGHVRHFVGAMPAALPAGKYALRVVFDSGPQCVRKAFKEVEFDVNAELARRWEESGLARAPAELHLEPEQLSKSLTAGRFTVASIVVSNPSLASMRLRCRLDTETLPAGWIEITSTDFTLGPGMRRSVICRMAIPDNAQPGDYDGTLLIEAESAGLISANSVEVHRIPVRITIGR